MVFIKVEPSGISMYSVHLIYDLEKPDGEDRRIKDYLAEHELEPKYQGEADYEGRPSEIMYFGGCYLGGHLKHIGEIQRRTVEEEIIAEEIERHLNAAGDDFLPEEEGPRREVMAGLVQEFHAGSSFQTNENGELFIALEEAEVLEAARRVAARA